MDFIPYKAHECFEHLYYQIPMELFFNKNYKDKLNSDSKILYGFLLNRLTLSAKNNWVDKDGNIFLIFTRKKVQELLGLSDKTVTKAHIALDIVNNEKNKAKLMNDFGYIPSKGEFIETIMNENCPAYVKKRTVSPKQAADIIREANGKVVLAHPVAYVHEDGFIDGDILNIINNMKLDGLEANYIYVDRNNNLINETKKWNEFAKESNLFVTIGSDFHNKDGIRPEIGFVNTNFALTDEEVDKIVKNILEQNPRL